MGEDFGDDVNEAMLDRYWAERGATCAMKYGRLVYREHLPNMFYVGFFSAASLGAGAYFRDIVWGLAVAFVVLGVALLGVAYFMRWHYGQQFNKIYSWSMSSLWNGD